MNPKRKLDESDITKRDLNCSRYWRQIKPKSFPHLMGFRLCERSPRFPLWYYSNKILQFYPFFFSFFLHSFHCSTFLCKILSFSLLVAFPGSRPSKTCYSAEWQIYRNTRCSITCPIHSSPHSHNNIHQS